MKRLKSLAVLTLAIATFGLIGCSSNEAEQSAETRTVDTVKGKVEIPAEPKRIVDISGSSEGGSCISASITTAKSPVAC